MKHFKLLWRKKFLRKLGNQLICQFHIQDVILIRDFLGGGFPGFRVGTCFGAVAYFHFLGQRQGVLHGKDTFKLCLCALRGVALQEGGQVRRKFVGVMPDTVKVVAVFIIAGVGAFDIVNLTLQGIFHSGVVLFRCHKVAVLGRVGRAKHPVCQARKHSPARGQPCGNHNKEKQRGNCNQNARRVSCRKCGGFPRFLGGFLRRLSCGFRCGFCPSFLCRLCILAFYLLFLHETGKRVRGKLRVVVQGLVILEVDVCLKCCLFCICCFPVGFQLMAAVALF